MADGHRVKTPHVHRFKLNGVTPVEIWDLMTDNGEILWQRQGDVDVLLTSVDELRAGTAVSRSDGPVSAASGIDSVYLTGGRLHDHRFTDTLVNGLRDRELRVSTSEDHTFAPALAALAGQPDSLVLDVGQTCIKAVTKHGRAEIQRDLTVLPIRDGEPVQAATIAGQRAAFARFVGEAISAAAAITPGGPPWSEVVLALPCSIEGEGQDFELGGSSYIAMAGAVSPLSTITSLVPTANWLVMNDAEMAVLAARETSTRPSADASGFQLVITLGFGVGGCVWSPAQGAGR